MEFARVSLLAQVELTTPASPATLVTARVDTEITLVMAAPEGDCTFTLFQGGTSPINRLVYQFPVNNLYQGPVLASQTAGGSIGLDQGDVLSAVLDSGTRLTLSVYGVTARIPVVT